MTKWDENLTNRRRKKEGKLLQRWDFHGCRRSDGLWQTWSWWPSSLQLHWIKSETTLTVTLCLCLFMWESDEEGSTWVMVIQRLWLLSCQSRTARFFSAGPERGFEKVYAASIVENLECFIQNNFRCWRVLIIIEISISSVEDQNQVLFFNFLIFLIKMS